MWLKIDKGGTRENGSKDTKGDDYASPLIVWIVKRSRKRIFQHWELRRCIDIRRWWLHLKKKAKKKKYQSQLRGIGNMRTEKQQKIGNKEKITTLWIFQEKNWWDYTREDMDMTMCCRPVKGPEERHELGITWNKYIEWKYENCARNWILTILPNGICTNQNPS